MKCHSITLGVGDMTNLILVILFHRNEMYHNIVIFALNKVLISIFNSMEIT